MSKQLYKIHVAFIDSNGNIIQPGTYEEGTFDLAKARHSSIVTKVDIDIKTTSTTPDTIPLMQFNQDESEVKDIKVEPTIKTVTVDFLKINSADMNTIAALKYVSKTNAETVVKLREEKRFESYSDLNKRVPLKFNRVWEDIVPIDFEDSTSHNTENAIYYSQGITPLN